MPDGRMCRCTGAGASRRPVADLASWNASAGWRWNRLVRDLRRELGIEVRYFKATEVQRRGALHFHAMLRHPEGGVLALHVAQLRRLAIKWGFGHEVDVQAVEGRHAGYVAKYASKASDERQAVPWAGRRRWERVDRQTGEVRKGWSPAFTPTYRTWSASSCWGRSMSEIRAAQGHHEAVMFWLPSWADREVPPEHECVVWAPRRKGG